MSAAAGSEEARLAFLARWLEDRVAGRTLPVAHYLALFPAAEAEIRREFLGATASEPEAPAAAGPAPVGDTESPERIGPYRLLRQLGHGGQGAVWLADDTRLRRRVALKVLHGPAAPGGERLRRLVREAEVQSRLDHPAIGAVLEVCTGPGAAWIAMRYVAGESLAARIRAARADREAAGGGAPRLRLGGGSAREDLDRGLHLVETAARALHAAHEQGIVHRDVKPGNIMVTPDGAPVVVDFGLARDASDDLPTLTRSGEALGTPAYMAPEQIAKGAAPPDRQTDVWGLGVVLFETLTLERPFEAPTPEGICRQVLEEEPTDPRRFHAAITKDLAAVIATALEKDRARRYRTAADLAEDLARVRERRPVSVQPLSMAERAVRWGRRRPAAAALVLTLAVTVPLLMSLGGYLLARWPDVQAEAARRRHDEAMEVVERGWFALEEGDRRGALALFGEALRAEPGNPDAAAGVATVHTSSREHAKAAEFLAGRPELVAEHPALRRLLAQALASAGRAGEAAALEAALGEPATALDFFAQGMRDLLRGEEGEAGAFAAAAERFTAASLHARTAHPLYAFKRAGAAGRARDARAAREASDLLVRLWPDAAVAWFHAGYALLEVDPAEAEVRLRAAIARRGDDPRFHFSLGNALRDQGRRTEARAAFAEALRLRPGYAGALVNRGNLLLDEGRHAEALADFEAAAALEPERADCWFNLGGCRQAMGRTDEARAAYEKALALRPGHARALANLASLFLVEGRPAEALPILERAALRTPGDPELHVNTGVALRALGRLDEAAAATRRALELDPRSVPARENLAIILDDAHRTDETVAAWRAVLEVKPGSAPAWMRLGRALRIEGDEDGAREALRRAQALQDAERASPPPAGEGR